MWGGEGKPNSVDFLFFSLLLFLQNLKGGIALPVPPLPPPLNLLDVYLDGNAMRKVKCQLGNFKAVLKFSKFFSVICIYRVSHSEVYKVNKL